MQKLVMLDVYSGHANPVWKIDEDKAEELFSDMSPLTEGELAPLGYRGFKILDADRDLKEFSTLNESEREPYSISSSFIGNSDVERALLREGQQQGAVDAELAEYVAAQIGNVGLKTFIAEDVRELTCPPCGGGAAPAYNPGYWNNDPTRLRSNNCYNYGNDKATNTFAQPGRASGSTAAAMACGDVRAAAQRDGLIQVPTFAASIPGVWYVALVVWPGRDYHWYRQDDNGCWSHKPGQTPARNVDNSNNRISDPRSCDRGPYTDFCSYMTTRPNANIR